MVSGRKFIRTEVALYKYRDALDRVFYFHVKNFTPSISCTWNDQVTYTKYLVLFHNKNAAYISLEFLIQIFCPQILYYKTNTVANTNMLPRDVNRTGFYGQKLAGTVATLPISDRRNIFFMDIFSAHNSCFNPNTGLRSVQNNELWEA